MIKYAKNLTQVVMQEIPDMISLNFSITNCQHHCKGCHSAFLRKNIGDELTLDEIKNALSNVFAPVDCILFMGEGNDIPKLLELAKEAKKATGLAIAIYSGRTEVEDEYYKIFDFVKVGPYMEECGPLNKRTTNQRLYDMRSGEKKDITYKFWIDD